MVEFHEKQKNIILYPKNGIKSIWLKVADIIKDKGEIILNKKLTAYGDSEKLDSVDLELLKNYSIFTGMDDDQIGLLSDKMELQELPLIDLM